MRWFFSFAITAFLVTTTAGLLWLREHSIAGVTEVSKALAWLIPDSGARFLVEYQLLLMAVLNLVILTALERWIAYSSSATEASPRKVGRVWTWLWRLAHTRFHNPTRWWLSTFTILVSVVAAASGVWVRLFEVSSLTELAWGLTLLFATTLVASMVHPDVPAPLRAVAEPAVDPILDIPGERSDEVEPGPEYRSGR